MNLFNFTYKLNALIESLDSTDYTVTCNRVCDIPLILIKNKKDKIVNTINLNDDSLEFCKKECNREVTIDDIVNDTEYGCNFCDYPYQFLRKNL